MKFRLKEWWSQVPCFPQSLPHSMARRVNMVHTFYVEHIDIYSKYICKYLGMFEGVQSLWALPAGTTPTAKLGHLNYVLIQRSLVDILSYMHFMRL